MLCQSYCSWHRLSSVQIPWAWVMATWVCEKPVHGEDASRWCSRTCASQEVEAVEEQKNGLSCPSCSACFPGNLSLPMIVFPGDGAESSRLCCNSVLAKLPAGQTMLALQWWDWSCALSVWGLVLCISFLVQELSCKTPCIMLPSSWQLLLCIRTLAWCENHLELVCLGLIWFSILFFFFPLWCFVVVLVHVCF